ncbi:MAG: DUF2029 domain-containing protein [Anaerolineae bacterium]|nr:DUF2029 domain-containing protein [Anaerolineae bacterium]
MKRWLWLLLLLVVGASLVRLAPVVVSSARHTSHGFAAYYTASRLFWEDPASLRRAYDDNWFRAQVARLHPASADIFNVNPPTMSLLFLPLARLTPLQARALWIGFNVLFLAVACLLLWWTLRPPLEASLLGLAFVCSYTPLLTNFRQGQAYVFLLLLLVLAFVGYQRRSGWLTGVPLALMFLFKSAGVFLWLFLLVRRRWPAVAWGAATVVAGVLLTIPWFGLGLWAEYARLVPGLAGKPYMGIVALQTLPNFFHHLLRYEAGWNPGPLVNVPSLAYVLATGVPLVILLGSAWLARERKEEDDAADILAFAIGVALSVSLSPWAEEYHYVLLLPALALVAHVLMRTWGPAWAWGACLLAALLLWMPLPFDVNAKMEGIKGLAGFPRVYAALLLAGLSLYLVYRPEPSARRQLMPNLSKKPGMATRKPVD